MAILHRGNVAQIREDGVMVEIPAMGPGHVYGPMEIGSHDLSVGDRVLVGQVENYTEDLVCVGPLLGEVFDRTYIYYFENIAARDVVFDGTPGNMVSPTFAWVDDPMTLYVWTDETNAWRQVSWNEVRVAGIESDVVALDDRVTDLEGLGVTDTATIDLALSGSWPKTLSASVVADSIPLGNLSDVAISSPATAQVPRYNGTSWVNALLSLDDLSDATISSLATGQTIRWNGSTFVNAKLALTDLNDTSISGLVANQGLVYNGTAWVSRGIPLGVIWLHPVASATTFATNFNVDTDWYSTSSPTIIANRSYKLTSRVVVFTGGGTQIKVDGYIKVNGTKILRSGAVIVGSDSSDVVVEVSGAWNSGSSPGTPTFAVGTGRIQGSSNYDMVARADNWAEFIIEDMGPERSD